MHLSSRLEGMDVEVSLHPAYVKRTMSISGGKGNAGQGEEFYDRGHA